MTSDAVPALAGRREWTGLAVLALTAMMTSFDLFTLLLALPHLSADLGADSIEQLWIVDIYGFLVGGFLITMGGLGDRIGRRKLLLIGASVFGVASVVSAYAPTPELLILARALLGVAGATLTPSTLSLISNMFHDQKQRGLAIGIWAGAFTVGAILGPIAGGILLEHFWWGSVFLLGVPVMLLLLVLGPIVLPEYRNPNAGRLDLVSALMSLAAILALIYGIKEAAKHGFGLVPVVAVAVGLVIGALFVRRQNRLADPLLDLKLFAITEFRVGLLGLFTYSVLTGAVLLLMTQWFQTVGGLSPLQAGLALLPGMALSTIGTTVAPIVARRFRPSVIIGVGLLVVVGALVWFTQIGPGTSPLVPVIAFGLWCAGGAPLLALGIGLVVSSSPPEKAGAASAMPQVSNEIGAALGFAVLGAGATAIYRGQMSDAVPAEVPADAAAAARESAAGATTVADVLPPDVLATARDAFTSGMQVVSAIAATLVAAAAVMIMVKLRHVPPLGAPAPTEQPTEDPTPEKV
ncbi:MULTISPECIES: MFS transporter [Actinokineospora]|uniref:MFS transporter n=1 Tax=Actinokineospora fastidiosa TaxID=1816 RepID=A0A918GU08_9PSEU|nr:MULTISPECIES: MFS transporter [Actinokineospora]UVS81475.1 Antiseptic resistance protein [Actinokineospora sp. UTMC 2448]GGS57882.1 MFS transporter [Actinokineospora fastidiosa]